jgi:hypothetical protein
MSTDLWVASYHEAGHGVMAYLHGATLEWVGIASSHEMKHSLTATPPEKFHLIEALVLVSGVVAAERFGGVSWQLKQMDGPDGDWPRFQKAISGGFMVQHWLPEDAEGALTALARDLLEKNEALCHYLAKEIMDRRGAYVDGDDAMRLLKHYAKSYGVRGSPLMADQWQTETTQALDSYRRRAQQRRARVAS